jgi:hypothetical protein
MGSVFFLFINQFFIQIPIKHSKYFDKLVYDHKKNKKQLQKSKSNRSQNDSCSQIYLLVQGEGKKIPRSNSPHEAKLINTKINYFGGQNRR